MKYTEFAMPIPDLDGNIVLVALPILPKPEPGETVVVGISDELFLPFALDDVKFSASGADLNLRLPEGGILVLEGALATGCVYVPHILHTPEGVTTLEDFLAQNAPEIQYVHYNHGPEFEMNGGVGAYRDAPGSLLHGVELLDAAPADAESFFSALPPAGDAPRARSKPISAG